MNREGHILRFSRRRTGSPRRWTLWKRFSNPKDPFHPHRTCFVAVGFQCSTTPPQRPHPRPGKPVSVSHDSAPPGDQAKLTWWRRGVLGVHLSRFTQLVKGVYAPPLMDSSRIPKQRGDCQTMLQFKMLRRCFIHISIPFSGIYTKFNIALFFFSPSPVVNLAKWFNQYI